jgi:homoserine kinase
MTPKVIIYTDGACRGNPGPGGWGVVLMFGDRRGGRFAAAIDFYFACDDLYAYDLAVCLNAWCFEPDGTFNVTRAQALIAGYEARRPLSPAEREALPILAWGAAMRFFLTRLRDWGDTTPSALVRPHDPLEYERKLAVHRAAQGGGGLMLLGPRP